MSNGIPYSRVEEALQYLAITDEPCAELKADVERTAYWIKAAKAVVVLHTDGTGPVKAATADSAEEVMTAQVDHCTAIAKHEAMKNERARNMLVIDVWRSLNSARNKGQII